MISIPALMQAGSPEVTDILSAAHGGKTAADDCILAGSMALVESGSDGHTSCQSLLAAKHIAVTKAGLRTSLSIHEMEKWLAESTPKAFKDDGLNALCGLVCCVLIYIILM